MTMSINGAVKRREFLLGAAAAVATSRAWGQAADQAKMKRIAIMTLSLGSILKSGRNPTGTVDILDFPEVVAQRLGIHNVELNSADFASWEPAYIAEFRKRLKKANSQVSQIIMNLGTLTPTAADLRARMEGIDHAVALGCPRVMVLMGSSLAPETRQTAIEALKTMVAYAKTKKVRLAMENFNISSPDGWSRGSGPSRAGAQGAGAPASPGADGPGGPGGRTGAQGAGRRGGGGYSAPWDVLVEVGKASGVYMNPDTGNFFDNAARMAGLPVMYRLTAGSSHVKYNPTQYDTGECIRISKRVGYKGLYSIEAGGGGRGGATDPFAGPRTILDIILANM